MEISINNRHNRTGAARANSNLSNSPKKSSTARCHPMPPIVMFNLARTLNMSRN
jgi:hypothetical protein